MEIYYVNDNLEHYRAEVPSSFLVHPSMKIYHSRYERDSSFRQAETIFPARHSVAPSTQLPVIFIYDFKIICKNISRGHACIYVDELFVDSRPG